VLIFFSNRNMNSISLIVNCCEAVLSAILAIAWLLVFTNRQDFIWIKCLPLFLFVSDVLHNGRLYNQSTPLHSHQETVRSTWLITKDTAASIAVSRPRQSSPSSQSCGAQQTEGAIVYTHLHNKLNQESPAIADKPARCFTGVLRFI